MEKKFKELDLVVFLSDTEIIEGEVIFVANDSLFIRQNDGSKKQHIVKKDRVYHSVRELWIDFLTKNGNND